MLAIVQEEFGGPEVLSPRERPAPEPGPGQVRVSVAAAGVHLIDTAFRRGDPPFPPSELPTVPGREVAGTVDAAGPGAEVWLGRDVVVHLGMAGGGYAEQVLVEAGSLHERPAGLEPAAAVAMIGTGRTALLLLDQATITAADTVLVTSAAGGLGALLVQAARRAGARVVGLAGGPEKTARVTALGAVPVDYRDPAWPEHLRVVGKDATVVLDGVGGEIGRAVLEQLRPGGRAVVFGFSSGDRDWFATARAVRPDVTFPPGLAERPTGAVLRGLESRALAEAAAGRLVPHVTAFPLIEAAAAHRALEERRTTGKVVLIP
ncbi:zinc-binding dehydrogenase [Pseudonocardia sp. CA-107938]|uniref:zinc-binding dehydrogenase n=1 Tax=Pseudonocardia sp. CA-107938 TaxID=3240021 RepID=UPI003D8BD36F